ncbi:hypothetical protein [Nocardioides sp. SYSU D00065]|uniref:hypothetical protein n=1 Tax=Nocardioides sp. SYSU D00065 TaxID=2817378 RepID=UPI001B344189|nr:hypothetical protein [Nocardioides sp. SYSU D00065]
MVWPTWVRVAIGVPFDELVRRLGGDRVTPAGRGAAVVPGGQTCFVHPLWDSDAEEFDAEGRDPLSTDAVVPAETCREARRVATTVIEATGTEPAAAKSVPEW